jgi:hypothetical protein
LLVAIEFFSLPRQSRLMHLLDNEVRTLTLI